MSSEGEEATRKKGSLQPAASTTEVLVRWGFLLAALASLFPIWQIAEARPHLTGFAAAAGLVIGFGCAVVGLKPPQLVRTILAAPARTAVGTGVFLACAAGLVTAAYVFEPRLVPKCTTVLDGLDWAGTQCEPRRAMVTLGGCESTRELAWLDRQIHALQRIGHFHTPHANFRLIPSTDLKYLWLCDLDTQTEEECRAEGTHIARQVADDAGPLAADAGAALVEHKLPTPKYALLIGSKGDGSIRLFLGGEQVGGPVFLSGDNKTWCRKDESEGYLPIIDVDP